MEIIAFTIGHAGVTLARTLTQLTTVFSTIRPRAKPTRASRSITDPDTDHTAKAHDYILFKSLQDLAQSRLIGIISNLKRLVEALPDKSSNIKAHSTANTTQTQVVT